MKRKAIVVAATLALTIAAASASALVLEAGDLVVDAEGGFAPTKLPKHEDAPIKIFGSGKASTKSGELPPIVDTLEIEFDRHGHVETKGLEVCTSSKLQSTTVPQARKACPEAIVGKGHGKAIVKFPEQKPIPVSSPITIFNGPKKHGNPTVLAHAYLNHPVVTTFIVPVEIEKIHKGIYGYRTHGRIPKIAGGAGVPIEGELTIGKKWTYKGKKHSYIAARCETGRLQARGQFTFKDGTFLSGTFLRPCQVRE